MEELLGYTPLDFLSSRISLQDRIHTSDADIAGDLFSPDHQVGLATFNIRLRHADGRIRCVRGSSKKIAKRNGNVRLRLKLQDARSLWKKPVRQQIPPDFRAMLENTDDFIFFKDRNHIFTCVSQNMIMPFDSEGVHESLLGLSD
ncbi:MAG: PAS domain-containing protein, partial [Candidatus Pacebacteria bacterium]|nr:PAS domain-containing protein [Candidatus Paceibacterota bacterium]